MAESRYYEITRGNNEKVYVQIITYLDDEVSISYFGKAPTVPEIKTLFKKIGLYERGIELNKNRISPFRLYSRVGMSGASDWYIRYVQDIAECLVSAKIVKTKFIMHVSMYDKVNKGVCAWLGDIVLVLAKYPSADNVKIREISESDYPTERDFHSPSKFDWDEYFREW